MVEVAPSPMRLVEVRMASRPHPKELLSGDAALVLATRCGVLVAVADGLGHGKEASAAAELALGTVRARADDDLESILTACHAALRRSRGCVISLASVADGSATLRWLGVGNIEGVIRYTSGESRRLLPSPGIVGTGRWRLHAEAVTFSPGDLLVMATDGIKGSGLDLSGSRGAPATVAADILANHARDDDDALVVAARRLATTVGGHRP